MVDLKLFFQVLNFLPQLVDRRWLNSISTNDSLSKLVDCVQLILGQAGQPFLGIATVFGHVKQLQLVLELGSFFLELVVVLLQHLDQLAVVLNFLLVEQLDVLNLDSEVWRYLGHFPESAVLVSQVFNQARQAVVLLHQLYVVLRLVFLLGPNLLESAQNVTDFAGNAESFELLPQRLQLILQVLALEGQVLVQASQLVRFLLVVVAFPSEQLQLLALGGECSSNFGLHDLLDAVDVVLGSIEFFFVNISLLQIISN